MNKKYVSYAIIGGFLGWLSTRSKQPSVQTKPVAEGALKQSLSSHSIKTLRANGLMFAYIEAGEGPLVLLLHGFPDNASTYDDALNRLAEAGYRAVAPFTRGYFPTEIPQGDDYTVDTLAKDGLAIISALGETEAYVVGHDWGASTAYAMANMAPDRVKKLVTLAIPHPKLIKPSFALLYRAKHFVLFTVKGYAEWYTRRKNYAYLDYLYDYWSPKWSMPVAQRNNIKASLSLPGRLKACLGYYRSLVKSSNDVSKTKVPTLTFAGGSDGALDLTLFEKMPEMFTAGYAFVELPEGGHFIQNQYPALFAEKVIAFFD